MLSFVLPVVACLIVPQIKILIEMNQKRSWRWNSVLGSLLHIQTCKRRRDACSRHSRSVRERYLATLIKMGCICKDLIARNLEPCCKEARRPLTRGTTAVKGDNGEKSSETMSRSIRTKYCCYSTEEETDSSDIIRKSGCTGNSKADRSSLIEICLHCY
jgi:hypothetical protein